MLSITLELQKPLPASQVILIGLLAASLVFVQELWQIVMPFETVVHESAHVLAGILTGRTILSVKIEEAGGGETNIKGKSGPGLAVFFFVGYIGPSAAGLIAALLISTGRMYAVLWLGLVLVAVMLLAVRNFFGALAIITSGVLLYLVARYGTTAVERAAAYFVAWFLLISGTKLAFGNIRRPKKITDAEKLANMTYVWEWVWCWLWLALAIAALAVGGRILIRGLAGL
jgi:hypothetical protein